MACRLAVWHMILLSFHRLQSYWDDFLQVKYLEVDLETTNQSSKENLQQAVLIERERFTQTQWDVEEMQRKCIEMELKLKCEQV